MTTDTLLKRPVHCQSRDLTICIVYCGKYRKIWKSRRDLDQTMPNVDLVRDIFMYHVVKFQVD